MRIVQKCIPITEAHFSAETKIKHLIKTLLNDLKIRELVKHSMNQQFWSKRQNAFHLEPN